MRPVGKRGVFSLLLALTILNCNSSASKKRQPTPVTAPLSMTPSSRVTGNNGDNNDQRDKLRETKQRDHHRQGVGKRQDGKSEKDANTYGEYSACPVTNDQSTLNSFLWRIKRSSGPDSYLFGTIHVPYTSVWDFIPDNSKDAFDIADSVYFELDLTNPRTIAMLASCQLLPAGESLEDILPRDLYRRLKRHMDYVKEEMPRWMTSDQRGHGLYADYMFNAITGNWQRKRPVWVMLMVNSLTESDIRTRGIPVLDLYLAQEAARMNKRTGSLERVDEQCLPLNDLNFSQVIFALNKTLSQHELYRDGEPWMTVGTDDLIHHYNCGDLNEVIFSHDTARVPNLLNFSLPTTDISTAKRIDDYFRLELIYKRNKRIVDRIDGLLNRKANETFMFACGAGHFLGNNTVLDNLKVLGYEVEHVAPDEELYPGVNQRRNRKQSFTHSLPASHIIISGDLDRIDPFYKRRRHRNRNNRHRNKKKRRKKGRGAGGNPTDNYRLKRPQFNELWVRLETSSFGPNSFLRPQNVPPVNQDGIYEDNSENVDSSANQYAYNGATGAGGRSRALAASSILSALCAACVLICYAVAWKLVHR